MTKITLKPPESQKYLYNHQYDWITPKNTKMRKLAIKTIKMLYETSKITKIYLKFFRIAP